MCVNRDDYKRSFFAFVYITLNVTIASSSFVFILLSSTRFSNACGKGRQKQSFYMRLQFAYESVYLTELAGNKR